MSLIFVRLAAAALVVLFGALALPTASEAQTTALVGNLDEGDNAASETVTPPPPSGGICARTDQVRDAIVARIQAARDCTQVTAAHLAKLGGRLKLAGKGISSLKAGDFAGLSKLREIWLENNQLTALPPGLFDGLSAVEILQLNGNHLVSLPVGAFDGLSAVWLLHLHDNRLSSLPVGVFDGLSSLQQLLLVDNRLSSLLAGVFGGLSDLTDLDLEESGLSSLPAGVFDGLSSLQRLNLEYNQLSDLPADVFDGLSSLTELTLKGNRLSHLTEGDVTKARRVDRRNDLWEITVEPDSQEAVTITLRGNRECGATGAVCTRGADPRPLGNSPSATVEGPPAEPLTASFEGMPAEHAGQGSFSFRVAFSEGISISYKTVRDASFTVTGGDVTHARRVDGRRDLWRIAIEPDSDETVTVRLPETTDCGASGAICAGDGRGLSHSLSATVSGPVGISVADARVEEAAGAVLEFAVTLERAAAGAVTVDYATSDGSAQAGDDYTATSGTLTFRAGETDKTVSVPVLDDAHDEGEQTLTLRLSAASGAVIADGEATGTIENTDPMPKAWLARFGRTASDHAVEAI
ncbi:Calx-beta domain-containing protein [Candidatus Rariloculus sp.]|uniref:Calx-beta domain-containing protein n=1 Tax=Candidatus Rariloculus sp. TaxID=3101265 RepID=UPI003D0DC607